jgi:2-polyprenyl-3-methyl-5-hydroxy-6-metoxy-1,4-benzoquinol methylase
LFEIDTAEKFDLITMFEVLEHLENDKEALRRVNSLLREGGVFLFSVPSKAKLWGESDIIGGHFRRYEKDELIHLVNESGFEVLEFICYGFPWLNIAKFVRDRLARRALNQEKGKSKISLSKQSGLNIAAHRTPLLECFFNRYILFLPMKISSLFNKLDLAEAYLCLARRMG